MKFRSRSDTSGYTPEVRKYPLTMPEYKQRLNPETHELEVYKAGDSNVYMQKQEAVQDTLIYNLIDRIERTGDMSLLGQNVGGLIDTLDMPSSLMEAENVRLQAQQLFDSLPIEERRKYGYNLSAFLRDVDKELKLKRNNLAASKRDEVSQESVQEDVNASS